MPETDGVQEITFAAREISVGSVRVGPDVVGRTGDSCALVRDVKFGVCLANCE